MPQNSPAGHWRGHLPRCEEVTSSPCSMGCRRLPFIPPPHFPAVGGRAPALRGKRNLSCGCGASRGRWMSGPLQSSGSSHTRPTLGPPEATGLSCLFFFFCPFSETCRTEQRHSREDGGPVKDPTSWRQAPSTGAAEAASRPDAEERDRDQRGRQSRGSIWRPAPLSRVSAVHGRLTHVSTVRVNLLIHQRDTGNHLRT